jgi:uncharacterized protein (TIGR01370 family)
VATLPFLYQLQGESFGLLSSQSFRVAVVDMDDANLSASQVATLHGQGKTLYTYLSIGEAEDYRDYWIDGHWSQQKPSFVLGENPDWEGNYSVKFWDYTWQQIMFGRVADAIAHGYDGMYLDIVDAYEVAQVRNAYTGPDIRQAMIDFVVALSQYAKALDPDFKVIPQNAVGLLALKESNPGVPNTAYLNAIDGVGVEDLWYDGDSTSSWTSGDLAFIKNAVNAGKFVLATSYPTQDAKQEAFVTNALNAGFIPFVADRDLTGVIDPTDLTIEGRMQGHDINTPWTQDPSQPPTNPPTNPVNTAPLAVTDSYNGSQGTSLVVTKALGLLANDSDVDGNMLKAITVTAPGHGTLLLNVDGSFTYTPASGFSGLDGFTYKANDGVVDSNTVTVKINVAPIVVPGDPLAGNDTIQGTYRADKLDGHAGNDTISGRSDNDRLDGGDGNDRLDGGSGNDTLLGGTGDDTIIGGSGRDVMTGGSGADSFVFMRIDDTSTWSSSRDVITDFEVGRDHIDLSAIDANTSASGNQAFTLLAAAGAPFTGAGQVRFSYATISGVQHTIVEGNVDRSLGADFKIDLVGHLNLTSADFAL